MSVAQFCARRRPLLVRAAEWQRFKRVIIDNMAVAVGHRNEKRPAARAELFARNAGWEPPWELREHWCVPVRTAACRVRS